jgi:3-oxoacyl-[acyl-carrier protein] reductase
LRIKPTLLKEEKKKQFDIFLRNISKNANVNAITPGMIWTDMIKNMPPEQIKQMDAMLSFIVPMNRKGSPQDIANLALFLASDESSFITGQIIFCDGGMKM